MARRLLWSIAGLAAVCCLHGANLIPGDTSFETEPDTMVSGKVSPAMLPFSWDDREAFHGKRSIRVDWDRKNRLGSFGKTNASWVDKHLGCDTVDLEYGETYTFSFYAKAKHEGAAIGVMLMPNAYWRNFIAGSDVIRKEIPLPPNKWTRISVPFKVLYRRPAVSNGYGCLIRFTESSEGSYWLDAFQVDKGAKAMPYQPSAPMHCGVRLDVPEGRGDIRSPMWAAYYAGEDKITGTVRVASNDGKGGKLTLRTIDWLGRTVSEFSRDNVKEAVIPLSYDSNRRGWFKTTASITRGGKEIVSHSANFIVIDRPAETVPGIDPFFGMIAHHSMLPLMKRIGVKAVQVNVPWRTGVYSGLEPEKGKYDFRSLDFQIQKAKQYGMRVKLGSSATDPPEWYFDPKIWAEAKKYPTANQLLVSKAGMEGWKKRVLTTLERYPGQIDYCELGGEDDGRLGANPYYKTIHPEWVESGKVVRGEAFELLNDTAAELARTIRKKYPQMKVSPIRPAGGVGGDPWTYVFKAFDRSGKYFNEFGIDCYMFYPYHIGPEIKSVNANLDGREWTWNRIRELIRRNGGHHKVYMSEASLRIDTRFTDESKWEVERAEMLAKDFLICRALGMYAYFLFAAVGGDPHDQYGFDMQTNQKMQIPLPAVCQTARLIENSVKTRYIRQPGASRITLFRKHDGSGAAGIWAERGYFFQPADPKALTVMDMMGNKLDPDKEGKYMLGTAPVLITGPKYEAMEDSILKGEIAQGEFCRVFSDIKRKDTLTVELENTSSKKDHRIRLEIRSAAGTHSREATLPAGGWRRFTLPAAGPKAEIGILNLDTRVVIRIGKDLPKPIVLTGKSARFALVSERAQMIPSDPWAPWHGRDDLSAEISGSWDEQNLLVEARVKDDLHFSTKPGPWDCDSVQIAIDPKSNGGLMKKIDNIALHEVISEVAVSLRSPGNGKLNTVVSYGRKDLLADPGSCTVTRDAAKKATLYRFRIPWSKLGIKPEKGRVFGMSLVIFDDDTGTGKEIMTEIGGGIIGRKDPRKYLKFVLE